MKNNNGFWQALKANVVSRKVRTVWKLIVWLIKLGLMFFKLLEWLDKHRES